MPGYIVIVGNPFIGEEAKFYGPFVDRDAADSWISANHPNEYTHTFLLERP
jgi:hypothetical protein